MTSVHSVNDRVNDRVLHTYHLSASHPSLEKLAYNWCITFVLYQVISARLFGFFYSRLIVQHARKRIINFKLHTEGTTIETKCRTEVLTLHTVTSGLSYTSRRSSRYGPNKKMDTYCTYIYVSGKLVLLEGPWRCQVAQARSFAWPMGSHGPTHGPPEGALVDLNGCR